MKGVRIKKKVIYSISVIAVIGYVLYYIIMNMSSVEDGVVKFVYGEYGHLKIDEFIFDTGAEMSIVFKKTDDMNKVFYILMSGLNKELKIEDVYYSNFHYLDSLKIHHAFWVYIDTCYIPDVIKKNDGILGMNIISQNNWHFNFKDSTLKSTSKKFTDVGLHNSISFKYGKQIRPLVSIYIEDVEIKEVLFDTGSNSMLTFGLEDLKKINSKHIPQDTVVEQIMGLYHEDSVVKYNKYTHRQIKINGRTMDSVYISEDNRFPRIGLGFVRKFDNLYIDTKNKMIYLYN